MKISEAINLKETKDSISKAFESFSKLIPSQEDKKPYDQSKINMVQHSFTDKLICLKDSYYLKLLHREGVS